MDNTFWLGRGYSAPHGDIAITRGEELLKLIQALHNVNESSLSERELLLNGIQQLLVSWLGKGYSERRDIAFTEGRMLLELIQVLHNVNESSLSERELLLNGIQQLLILWLGRGGYSERGDIAITRGEVLLELVKALHNVNESNPSERELLLNGIQQLLKIQDIYGIYVSMPDWKDGKDRKNRTENTPLHEAVRLKLKYLAQALLEKNASVNSMNDRDETPLLLSIKSECIVEVINSLLNSKDIRVHIADIEGNTPLHWAIIKYEKYGIDLIKRLVEKDADSIKTKNKFGETPLLLAIRTGCGVEVINSLLNYEGISVNIADIGGNTPLHWAIYKYDVSLIECLVEKGARIDAKNQFNETPLSLAKRDTNVPQDIVSYLSRRAELEEEVRDAVVKLKRKHM